MVETSLPGLEIFLRVSYPDKNRPDSSRNPLRRVVFSISVPKGLPHEGGRLLGVIPKGSDALSSG
jgi:hypothetical protein